MGSSPRSDHGSEQCCRGRPTLLEPPCGPAEEWDHEEHQLKIGVHHEDGYGGDEEQERPELGAFSERSAPRPLEQDEEERGNDQNSHGVAGPPHRPCGQELACRYGSGKHQRARPDGSADQHAQQRCQEDDGQGVLQSVDLSSEAHPDEQERRNDRSQRIARCRRGGGQPVRADGQVDRESRQRNARPHAPTEDEERHDRDARRWPQRCYVPLDQREPQSEDSSHVIGATYQDHLAGISKKRGPIYVPRLTSESLQQRPFTKAHRAASSAPDRRIETA